MGGVEKVKFSERHQMAKESIMGHNEKHALLFMLGILIFMTIVAGLSGFAVTFLIYFSIWVYGLMRPSITCGYCHKRINPQIIKGDGDSKGTVVYECQFCCSRSGFKLK